MNKKILLLTVLCSAMAANAGFLRVSNVDASAPYSTIATAVSAATEGDTIMIDGTSVDYEATTRQPIAGDSIVLSINVSRYGSGIHTFNCRLLGNNGKWTDEYSYPFTLDARQDAQPHEPVMAEYFFDNDPGYGKAFTSG